MAHATHKALFILVSQEQDSVCQAGIAGQCVDNDAHASLFQIFHYSAYSKVHKKK